jgi:hypothetical protein
LGVGLLAINVTLLTLLTTFIGYGVRYLVIVGYAEKWLDLWT